MCRHEQDPSAGESLDDLAEDLLRGAISPVNVLDDHHQWPLLTSEQDHLAQDVVRSVPDRFGRLARQTLGPRPKGEELEQVRDALVHVHVERLQLSTQARDDRLG
jgi:hypothetical protein